MSTFKKANIQFKRHSEVLLVLTFVTIFAITITIRLDQIWNYDEFGSVLGWTKQWVNEGPVNLRFGLYDYFPSLEARTLEQRRAYFSYPPGLVFLPWLVSSLTNIPPSGSLLVICNWFNHFIFASSFGGVVYIYGRENYSKPISFILAVNAFSVLAFARGPMAYFTHSPVHDVIGLSWISLYFFLATLERCVVSSRNLILIRVFRGLIAGIATLTDWFSIVFIAFHVIYRVIYHTTFRTANHRHVVLDLLCPVISLLAFIVLLITSGNYWKFVNRGLQRSSMDSGAVELSLIEDRLKLVDQFPSLISWNLNSTTLPILKVQILFLFVTACLYIMFARHWSLTSAIKKHEVLFLSTGLGLICVSYNALFVDHSINHLWSGLKYSLVFVFFCMTFWPIAIKNIFDEIGEKILLRTLFVRISIAIFLIGNLAWWFDSAKNVRANFTSDFSYEINLAQSLKPLLTSRDIVVSPSISGAPKSVVAAEAEHVVNPVGNVSDLVLISACLKEYEHSFVFIIDQNDQPAWHKLLNGLRYIGEFEAVKFYRVERKILAELASDLNPTPTQCSRYIMQ